jgi:hypothetical protein
VPYECAFIVGSNGLGSVEVVQYIHCQAMSRQQDGGFCHPFGTATGPMQANHCREALLSSMGCGQKAVYADSFPVTFESQLRLGNRVHGDGQLAFSIWLQRVHCSTD